MTMKDDGAGSDRFHTLDFIQVCIKIMRDNKCRTHFFRLPACEFVAATSKLFTSYTKNTFTVSPWKLQKSVPMRFFGQFRTTPAHLFASCKLGTQLALQQLNTGK